MAPKVAIVFYSMYGHIQKLAEAEKEGLKKAGIEADLYQVAETLPQDVLAKMHAPPKSSIPIIDPATLANYDAFLFGIPTRYGNFPAQWKAFWDATGTQWQTGGYWGKYAGIFVSSATPGGGQESTVIASLSTLTHHGIIYVPLGYAKSFPQLANLTEVRGGSPWGAGTFAAADGSRQPSPLELELATIQGEEFGKAISKGSATTTNGGKVKPETTVADSNGATKHTQQTNQRTDIVQAGGETGAKVKEGPCGLPAKCIIQ
ncbi:minor allergen Alt a 7 [Sclerotinia borealis F-4128]|uniref:Minor allergen Alt a 7 n=1 Tax=Sclerotinia borealis (strain F-4128) TaxID=1432307 RepID=W9CRV3_SCLBF|nr:minor allergen Alt a 7 [Sclerotinia borealis F-4128]